MNVCLECPVFNALGAAVCRPQSLAGRWAGRRAERRVAWPWWRRQCKFFVSYHVGKMLKSMSVFLKCEVFIALAAAVYRPHRIARRYRIAGRCTERRIAWPWWRPQSFFLCRFVLTRGGQAFPKSTEIRNSVPFRAYFSGFFFRPFFSVVAESVSEQLLQRIGGLGGQFWLSKESVSTSATDYQIPTSICTKYGLQKVRTCKIDGLYC